MSRVDDILFAPIKPADPAWLVLTNEINRYLEQVDQAIVAAGMTATMRPIDRPRPLGSLFLLDLMNLHHLHSETKFWVVSGKGPRAFYWFLFDGTVHFGRYEDFGYPILSMKGGKSVSSIRDLNLFPNRYNNCYVFSSEDLAREYYASLQ